MKCLYVCSWYSSQLVFNNYCDCVDRGSGQCCVLTTSPESRTWVDEFSLVVLHIVMSWQVWSSMGGTFTPSGRRRTTTPIVGKAAQVKRMMLTEAGGGWKREKDGSRGSRGSWGGATLPRRDMEESKECLQSKTIMTDYFDLLQLLGAFIFVSLCQWD